MSPRIGADLDTIVRAAAEIADAAGLDAVSLASVAQKLQIKSPSLYNHVDGLPALRRKLAVHGLELVYERLVRAAEGRHGADAVLALAGAYVEFSRLHPGLYAATLRAPDREDPEWAELGGRLVGLVVQALAPYRLSEEGALHAVRGFRSIIQGFTTLERAGGFGLPLELDRSLKLLMEAFLTGIGVYQQVGESDVHIVSTDCWDDALWALAAPVYEAGFPEHGRKPEAIIRRMFNRGLCRLHLLLLNGSAAGMALSGRDPETGYLILDYLAVDPSLRGRGLGLRLADHIRLEAGEDGCRGLLVEAEAEPTEENRSRIRFWERCGYRLTDYVHTYVWVPEPYRAMLLELQTSGDEPDGRRLFEAITRFHERAYRK